MGLALKGILTSVKTGKDVDLDLDRLIEDKALIQATNGGGKSHLVRRICESSTRAKIPQCIIQKDPEFNTLRDKFDYIIVGDKSEGEADIQISLKIAEKLAQKVLELPTISFIIDLSAMIVSERKTFVKRFYDVFNSCQKKYWHDRFFILDEAHIFAPEKGKGQSEALHSIEELASQGRKRGFSLIACTQRPSKLSKDVTSELATKFIGKAIDPEDRRRNAEELGMSTKPNDTIIFRKLGRPNFHFYAFGSAVTQDEPILVKGNLCETEHEIVRGSKKKAIPTRKNLQEILSTLEDLPEEVKKEKETIESLKKELAEKNQELQYRLQELSILEQKRMTASCENNNPILKAQVEFYKQESERLYSELVKVIQENTDLAELGEKVVKKFEIYAENHQHLLSFLGPIRFDRTRAVAVRPKNLPSKPTTLTETQTKPRLPVTLIVPESTEEFIIDKIPNFKTKEIAILHEVAAVYPNSLSRSNIATLCGIKAKGSTMSSYLSRLRTNLLIAGTDMIGLTKNGKIYYESKFQVLPEIKHDHESILQKWLPRFKTKEQEILRRLCSIYPNTETREELASFCNISPEGSTLSSYLSRLRTNALIRGTNELQASESLFP